MLSRTNHNTLFIHSNLLLFLPLCRTFGLWINYNVAVLLQNQQFQFLSEFREKNQPELFLTYNHIWSMYNPYDYEYDRMHSSERGDGSVVSAYSLHSSETDIIEYDRNLSAEISSLFTLLGIKSESEAELEKEMDMNIVDVPGGAPHATDAFSHVLKLERNVCKSNVRKLVQLLKEQHVRKLTYNCRQLLNHS